MSKYLCLFVLCLLIFMFYVCFYVCLFYVYVCLNLIGLNLHEMPPELIHFIFSLF